MSTKSACVLAAAITLAAAGPPDAEGAVFLPPTHWLAQVDGQVNPGEYFDGAKLPLQDFAQGGANGDLFLEVNADLQTLYIGMHVAETSDPPRGLLELVFDARRPDTLDGVPGADVPQAADRRVVITYRLARSPMVTIAQTKGEKGAWVLLASPDEEWATQLAVARSSPGFVDIELAIRLRPSSASASGPLADKKLGLGITHHGVDGSFVHLPNKMNGEPLPGATLTWETILFELPPRIPLDLTTFNVGQMPWFAPDGDGGDGEPADVAAHVFRKEVVCLEEMWSNSDVKSLLDELHTLRAAEGWNDFEVAGLDADFEQGLNPYDDDGVILLSARPIVQTGTLTYSACAGPASDCRADKGAVWARVLIEGGEPTVERAGNADNFIDVFCTHLNNDDNDTSMTVASPKAVRQSQLEELRAFVGAKAAADRPAFVMGDFNIAGAEPEYPFLVQTMGLFPTGFDVLNTQMVDDKDLGALMNPVAGTFMGDACTVDEIDKLPDLRRIDYILQIPPTQEWPDWGVASAQAEVDPNFISLSATSADCLSDHAMLEVHLELVRSSVPPAWNPMKDHLVTFTVTKLVDHASGGCCADWYTPALWLDPAGVAVSDAATPDGTVVYPGDTWTVATVYTDHDVRNMSVEVWEADSGSGDDHYDVTGSGLDPQYELDHWYGEWNRLDKDWLYDDTVGSFGEMPDGMYVETWGDVSEDYGDTGLMLTATELP